MLRQFPCLVLPRNAMILQHLILISYSNRPIICEMVAYWRSKTEGNFKLLALKVVAETFVIFENWSLRRGGRLRERSQPVRLHILHVITSLLVYSKPTKDDHLNNLRAKQLTLGNHAVNGNFNTGQCGKSLHQK